MTQHCGVKQLTRTAAILDNDDIVSVDAIIVCTGYGKSFPFLHKDCHLTVSKENRVTPLYKHIIHTEFPTLIFIGVPVNTPTAFHMFTVQVKFAMATLDGTMILPCREVMDDDTDKDYQRRLSLKMSPLHAHSMERRFFWDYIYSLAALAGCEVPSRAVKALSDHNLVIMFADVLNFREKEYRIDNEDTFTEVERRCKMII